MNNMEEKHLLFPLEIKSFASNGSFAGYASIFNMVDNQKDVVATGAFKKTIAQKIKNIKLLWQHDIHEPIGYFTDIKEDEFGLYVEGKLLLEVKRAMEAYELLRQGVLDGLSIGYAVKDFYIDKISGVRVLSEVELYEISLVTFPANQNARVTNVKTNFLQTPRTIRRFEEFLREAGYSRKEAKAISSTGFRQRDAADSYEELNDAICHALKTIKQLKESYANIRYSKSG